MYRIRLLILAITFSIWNSIKPQTIDETSVDFGPSFLLPSAAVEAAARTTVGLTAEGAHSQVTAITSTFINDTAVEFSWTYNGATAGFGFPQSFFIEFTPGAVSFDYQQIGSLAVSQPASATGSVYTASYTIGNLLPESVYSIRVVPVFASGASFASPRLIITTLSSPINYWERVHPRRESIEGFSQGYARPGDTKPLLDEGVEVFGQHTHISPYWQSDSPTDTNPSTIPEGRRGSSLSYLPELGMVVMFGGRTSGVSCSGPVNMDTANFGLENSGLNINPCILDSSEVNDIWLFDVSSVTWKGIINASSSYSSYDHYSVENFLTQTDDYSTSNEQSHANSSVTLPAGRELHAAGVLAGDVYIFGGRHRPSYTNATGIIADVIYDDLWRLSCPQVVRYFISANLSDTGGSVVRVLDGSDENEDNNDNFFSASATGSSGDGSGSSLRIPQAGLPLSIPLTLPSYLSNNNTNTTPSTAYQTKAKLRQATPRRGLCLTHLTVSIQVNHPCIEQVKLTMTGPGVALTSDPNSFPSDDNSYSMTLLDQETQNGVKTSGQCTSGVFNIVLDDDYNEGAQTCCDNSNGQIIRIHPRSPLSSFYHGPALSANFTVSIVDMINDDNEGYIMGYGLTVTSAPCFVEDGFRWENMTNRVIGTSPPGRYEGMLLPYESSLFLFGGRDQHDSPLTDLWRLTTSPLSPLHTNYYSWVELTPTQGFYSNNPFQPSMASGGNLLLTNSGLLALFGLLQNPTQNLGKSRSSSYVSGLIATILDPLDMSWSSVDIQSQPYAAGDDKGLGPSGRYHGSMVYIPPLATASNLLGETIAKLSATASYRWLFDQPQLSSQSNSQGLTTATVMLFGGDDDSGSGAFPAGTSGGLLADTWLLRLNTLSTPQHAYNQGKRVAAACKWRLSSTRTSSSVVWGCLEGSTGAECSLRDLLLMPFCQAYNATLR